MAGCESRGKTMIPDDMVLKANFYPDLPDLTRGLANASRYGWAKKIKRSIISDADWWVKKSDDFISEWISELTPFKAIKCPGCSLWRYNWSWDKDKPEEVTCKDCKGTFYAKDYPEQDRDFLVNPVASKYRWEADERIQGNIKPLVRFHKVKWVEASIQNLGFAYAFTGDLKYAQKAAVILKRLAQVYPGWIVHDWTHMYPADSPEGFAGKSSGWKIADAELLKNSAITYNYIYSSGVLSEEDKEMIQGSLFRVGADFLTALPPETALTNGAPQLLLGTAALGRILEDHDVIAYTVRGFEKILEENFLEDGHWWEASPSYAIMALNDFYQIPEVLQGYTDPLDYQGEDAFRDLDMKGHPFIREIFTALGKIGLPNGTLPAINDSHVGAKIPKVLLEALYSWYGEEEYVIGLDEAYNGRLKEEGSLYAFFKRPPDIRVPSKDQAKGLENHLASGLGLGILRAGEPGRETVLMMDFGPHGGYHGHNDKLNIIFWANGAELLTDQGYIYSSAPLMKWIRSSISHNLVVVDLREQAQTQGQLRTFAWSPGVQMVSADAPDTYKHQGTGVTLYNRTSALIGSPGENIYGVDIFRVRGGRIHDWMVHTPNEGYQVTFHGVSMEPGTLPYNNVGRYSYLKDIQVGNPQGPWAMNWDFWRMRIDMLGCDQVELYSAHGPGQRLLSGKDKDTQTTVIMARRMGQDLSSQFISILQPYKAGPFIKSIQELPFTDDERMTVGFKVELDDRVDYILGTLDDEVHRVEGPDILFSGEFGILSLRDGDFNYLFLANGTRIEGRGHGIEGETGNGMWLKRINAHEYELKGTGMVKVKLPYHPGEVSVERNGLITPTEQLEVHEGTLLLNIDLGEGESAKLYLN
jgi:hypothetical protein